MLRIWGLCCAVRSISDGFHRQYYFPYYKGSGITTSAEVAVEKRVGGDSFAGVCDDGRVGVSLIFYRTECRTVSERADIESGIGAGRQHDIYGTFDRGNDPVPNSSQ